jgi:hypothetical protein
MQFLPIVNLSSIGTTVLVSDMCIALMGIDDILQVWTVPTAVADITITVCMIVIVSRNIPVKDSHPYSHVHQLYHARSSSYLGETRDRLSYLYRLTIQTGFLTSILALPIAPLYFRGTAGIQTLT